jgi:hypothetical protein
LLGLVAFEEGAYGQNPELEDIGSRVELLAKEIYCLDRDGRWVVAVSDLILQEDRVPR